MILNKTIYKSHSFNKINDCFTAQYAAAIFLSIGGPDMNNDRYETEKSHIAFWSSLSKCLHVQK